MISKAKPSESNDEQQSNGLVRCSSIQLGELASQRFCPRCFYYKLRLHDRLPWLGPSDISTTLSSIIKQAIHAYFDEHSRLPFWLAPLGEISRYHQVPHWSRFNTVVDRHRILLTGVADCIFERADGSFVIVDFQIASQTSSMESALHEFEVQLNAKALIAERCGFSPVAHTHLVLLDSCCSKSDPCIREADGPCLHHSVRVHSFSSERRSLKSLFERVRALHRRTREPRGRRGCMECVVLQRLFRVHARSR